MNFYNVKNNKVRKLVYIVLIAAVMVLGTIGFLYSKLLPGNHFRKGHLPILAVPTVTNPNPSTIGSGVSLSKDGQFNVLLLGIDARRPNEPSRTDSIMVIHADLVKHQYEAISIPRDTRVYLPGYGYTKITHANFLGELKSGSVNRGADDAIQAVSNLTGLTINFYAETNYWGLQDMVNAVGGVDMYVPFNVKLTHVWYPDDKGKVVTKGVHFLDGQMVTEVTHERYSLANGDFGRQQLQEEAIIGIAKEVTKPQNIPRTPTLVKSLSKFLVVTNMTNEDMISLALGLKGFRQNQIHYFQVPGHSAYEMDPVLGQKLYYWIPDNSALRRIIASQFQK